MFYTYVGKRGNDIHHIGYDKGKKFHNTIKFKPSLYYETVNENDVDAYSINNKPLKRKQFDSISEWSKFYYQNKDILDIYSDLDPTYQFIAAKYKSAVEYEQKQIRVWFLDIEVQSDTGFPYPHEAKRPIVSIAIYDSKRNEYLILGLKEYSYNQHRMPLNTNKVTYKQCDDEVDLMQKFIELNAALKPDIWIAHNGQSFDYPYIINRLEKLKMNANELSPIGRASSKYTEIQDKFMSSKSEYYNSIEGISLLDNMLLYKKYLADPRESYSLSNLAIEDLGIDKIDYAEYDNLTGLYAQNYEKFIDYNINDVYLMFLLNQKNGYLDIHIRNMYKSKCANFEDNMGPVKLWDIYIYQSLQQENIQVLPTKKDVTSFSYPGAYVVDPIVGKHKWIMTFDLNSLYPHIQMQWNISPECVVDNLTVTDWLQSLSDVEINEYIEKAQTKEQKDFLKSVQQMNNFGYSLPQINREEIDERILNQLVPTHPEYVMSANGFYFKKDKIGCIPKLLIENYAERKSIKREVSKLEEQQEKKFDSKIADQIAAYRVSEQGIKIMMNSEYGALANNYFRYCRYELCSAITMNGQLVLKTLINNINKKYPSIKVIFGDTDSVGLGFDTIVKENCKGMSESEIIDFLIKFSDEQIQPLINDTYQQLSEYVGAAQNYMKMSREKIISDGIWTAKKHYAFRLVVKDNIILSEPKYGYKGLECVKSSIPRAIRKLQKQTIEIILTDESKILDKINQCESIIKNMSPEEIAFPKTCNGLFKYNDGKDGWIKGAQAHVKAALTYNKYLEQRPELINQYPKIQEGEKIRFVWLKSPNIFNSETFGFINRLPKDKMIIDFIDYDTMCEKAYTKVMRDMIEKIGLQGKITKVVDLSDLF